MKDRFQCYLENSLYNQMLEAAKYLGTNNTEVFHRALRLYMIALEHQKQGNSIILHLKSGKEREIILL